MRKDAIAGLEMADSRPARPEEAAPRTELTSVGTAPWTAESTAEPAALAAAVPSWEWMLGHVHRWDEYLGGRLTEPRSESWAVARKGARRRTKVLS